MRERSHSGRLRLNIPQSKLLSLMARCWLFCLSACRNPRSKAERRDVSISYRDCGRPGSMSSIDKGTAEQNAQSIIHVTLKSASM